MARLTGLEPATPGVTGRYSNQLSYNRSLPLENPSVRRVIFSAVTPVKQGLPIFGRKDQQAAYPIQIAVVFRLSTGRYSPGRHRDRAFRQYPAPMRSPLKPVK